MCMYIRTLRLCFVSRVNGLDYPSLLVVIFFATKRERSDSCMRYFMKCPQFLRIHVTSNRWTHGTTVPRCRTFVDKLASNVTKCPPDVLRFG